MSTSTQQDTTTASMTVPSSSTFSFTAPFPPTSSNGTIKQRRVSLALASSPKVFPAWSFRDDTTIDSHVTTGSTLVPEKKGKMRRIATEDGTPADKAPLVAEKRQRKKWTEDETNMLVKGCNKVFDTHLCSLPFTDDCMKYGVGNWKAILNDPALKFDSRSPVDLKDRYAVEDIFH